MDLFLRACGAGRPWQLRLEGPAQASPAGACRSFERPSVVIGCDPRSDLVLDHKEVGARHAYLQWIGGRLYCVDLGSQCGTWLGGQRRRSGWVEPAQAIRIGPYWIQAQTGDEGAPAHPPAPGSTEGEAFDPDLLPLTVELSHRGFKASECQIARGLSLVGSASDCQVRILDPGVSNIHCSLVHTPLGVWVVDLLGTGGIQVNGTPVPYARLHPGDLLQVGRSSIRVPDAAASNVPAAARVAAALVETPTGPHHIAASSLDETPGPAPAWTPDLGEPESEPEPEPEPVIEPDWERPAPEYSSSRRRRQLEDEAFARISAQERRGSCRYPVADALAVLSWWEPMAAPTVVMAEPRVDRNAEAAPATVYSRMMARWPGSHNGTPSSRAAAELARDPLPPVEKTMTLCTCWARLIDISQTGLLVRSETIPPVDAQVWLRLEDARLPDWVEVVVKGGTPEPSGVYRVRLAFRESCPYDLFKAVVYTRPGS
jgi:pSer/pThr/pTyr-binding forkhead associated (FHA) protein